LEDYWGTRAIREIEIHIVSWMEVLVDIDSPD